MSGNHAKPKARHRVLAAAVVAPLSLGAVVAVPAVASASTTASSAAAPTTTGAQLVPGCVAQDISAFEAAGPVAFLVGALSAPATTAQGTAACLESAAAGLP